MRPLWFLAFFIVTAAGGFTYWMVTPNQSIPPAPQQSFYRVKELHDLKTERLPQKPLTQTKEFFVGKNSSVYQTLSNAGLESAAIHALVQAVKPIYDLSRIALETQIDVVREIESARVSEVRILLSKVRNLVITHHPGEWRASFVDKEITKEVKAFGGTVLSTLWESAVDAGMNPQSISQLADIFAWQLDFEREVRPKDKWQIAIEQHLVDGEHYDWGPVLAAHYWLQDELYTAILYKDEDDNSDYYNLDGGSLRGKFLKSPLRYSRISSKFQRKRFHPILGIKRPHLGVDYAAPKGTPVRSVGEGRVIFRGRQGGSGKTVKIRHNSIYKTAYKHLNGYAPGIKNGSRVKQGQVIGYVGMTGLATGPHLHFEFYERNRFVDPLGIKFPREKTLEGEELLLFKEFSQKWVNFLEDRYLFARGEVKAPEFPLKKPQLDEKAPDTMLSEPIIQ